MKVDKEYLLTTTLAMQVTLNSIDKVKGTYLYRENLKVQLQKVEKQFEEILAKGFDDIYMEEEKSFSIFIERFSDIAEWIAHAKHEEVLELGRSLKEGKYKIEDDG